MPCLGTARHKPVQTVLDMSQCVAYARPVLHSRASLKFTVWSTAFLTPMTTIILWITLNHIELYLSRIRMKILGIPVPRGHV
jgi:hypothetical protein